MSEVINEAPTVPFSTVVATGLATVLLASALAYVMMNKKKTNDPIEDEEPELVGEFSSEKYPGGRLTAYYASQTGTAESFAKTIEREGAENGFYVQVVDIEDVPVDDLLAEERQDETTGTARAVFLVATYGEGEPTDNSAEFVAELKARSGTEIRPEEEKKEELPPAEQSLQGLEYSVFGLGNRQYEHFNAMSKFFDATLERIGGTRVATTGYGDDDADLEVDFDTWRETVFWPQMKERYLQGAEVPVSSDSTHQMPNSPYQVEFVDAVVAKPDMKPEHIQNASRPYFNSFDCPVTANRELRSKEDSGSTVHVEIDISKADGLSYHTADNFGVLSVNKASVVESVAKSLNFDLDAVFTVKAAHGQEWQGAPFPNPISIRDCLTLYCDLTGLPRRSELKLLAAYAKDPIDKKALLRMASKEGKAEYKEKILEAHFGLADILRMCPSIEAPLEHFISFCPRLIPRFYTISSSSSVHPKSVHLTVAVTETKTPDGTVFKGLCSDYLAQTKPQQSIRVFNRESTFRLPGDASKPILMIGPGTGIAPMRALLQERSYQRSTLKKKVGKNILYFGCRKRSSDFLYESELKAFQKNGTLTKLFLAFSRERKEKVYVQHLLAKNGKDTWKLLDSEGAYVYVCGGTKMGVDVSDTLQNICSKEGNMSMDEAKAYLKKLSSEGRYVQELWS